MGVSIDKIKSLLVSRKLVDIENSIADKKKCTIYKDDLPLLAGFLKEEVETSELSTEVIENFITRNSDEIIDFAVNLLDKESPVSLSTGVAVSYSIYMIYLKEKGEERLAAYIKKRRIPNPNKFLEKLKRIKLKMNF